MSSFKLMPSLSEDGWVDDSIKTADFLLSHFFLSDFSQTFAYKGLVSSLPWIIQSTQGNFNEAIVLMRNTLSVYFNRYFNNVVVEINDITKETTPSYGELSIYVSFTDTTNKEFVVGKILHVSDLIITKIININNG